MKYAVTIPPASEPVTLQEAKDHLRVTGSDEDTLISALISAARVKAEEECGYAIVTQTLSAWWDEWPTSNTLCLPIYPAAAVSDIRYTDEDGVVQTLSDSDYTEDLVGGYFRQRSGPTFAGFFQQLCRLHSVCYL